MTNHFLRRLRRWEPFWVTQHDFLTGLTSPVTGHRYDMNKDCEFTPQTAAHFDVEDLLRVAGPRIRSIPHNRAPVDGEVRVLIRMLPLDLSKQKYGGKNRADTHLWPKGTYLQIHLDPNSKTIARPQILDQRKQQSHDTSKWLGICTHLDITSMVHSMWSSTSSTLERSHGSSYVQLGCYDSELYMFNLALCMYRSPNTLSTFLLNSMDPRVFKRVTLPEMYDRAKKIMDSNEVVLDCDSDGDDNGGQTKTRELKSFRFSIRDPITMTALKVPVRGKNCVHFSCFELGNFLGLNKSSSGQRWKCAHCEKFLSYVDLEHCPLTELAAKKFGDQISAVQYMVEIKEDKSMVLCKAVRTSEERARARKVTAAAAADTRTTTDSNTTDARATGGANEVVELLDSDSDSD